MSPSSWAPLQIFWLNHGKPIRRDPSNLLGWVGHGVRLFADNSGMLSYAYRRSFALRALNDAQVGWVGAVVVVVVDGRAAPS